MKIYKDQNGSHRFDGDNTYMGYFDKYSLTVGYGMPFTEWRKWDKEKHTFLIGLGFSLLEPPTLNT